MAGVMAKRRNVVQEKYTGIGAFSRRFVQRIGECFFFVGGVTQVVYICCDQVPVLCTSTTRYRTAPVYLVHTTLCSSTRII